MDLNWGKAVASTDAWAGSLDGALVALDTKRVTHLVVKRGLLFSTRFVVPVERLERWQFEGLYLDTSLAEFFVLPRLPDVESEPGRVTLGPRTRALLADGASLNLKGLRLSQTDRALTHLVVRHPGLVRRSLILPADRVTELGPGRVLVGIGKEALDTLPTYRQDHGIESDLWEALYTSEDVSDVDLKSINIRVEDGVVTLGGNVRIVSAVKEAERLARSVDGVAAVDNRVVTDWDIELAVASHISREAPRISDGVAVHTQLGTVTLEGHLPSVGDRNAFKGISSIPGVRRVEDRTEVRPPVLVTAEEASPAESGSTEKEPDQERESPEDGEPGA